MPDQHDTRYKRLFYNPQLVRELLESFVPLDFVTQLDFAGMERIDKSFVSRRNRKQEGDLLWRIPLAGSGGAVVYLYLLLEFQSTVDRFMSLRMLRYICEFYEYLRHATKPAPRTLPPVFPLVLYNGERDWDAPEELGALIRPRIAAPYLPAFRFHTVVEKDIPDAELKRLQNALAAVFYLEKSRPADVGARLQELAGIIRSLDHPVVDLLQGWITSYLEELPNFETNHAILVQSIPDKEARPMFGTALKEWATTELAKSRTQGLAEGRAEGRTEGRAEGILLDKQQTLLRQLDRRFGATPAARELVNACTDPEKLDRCLDLILDAPTADEVLAPLDCRQNL